MALIKEPLEVDFFVQPQPLSDSERQMLSNFIQTYKKTHAPKKKRKTETSKQKKVVSAE